MSTGEGNSGPSAPRLGFGQGIVNEFIARKNCYVSDWTDAWPSKTKVLASSISLFSTSLLTSIAFGLFYQVETEGKFGIVASLASGGITGIMQAFIGGHPLTLCGQTGPVSLLYIFIYKFAIDNNVPFEPWVAWIGFWTFIFHALVALFNLCQYKRLLTPFTCQIFEMLVCTDFITTGIKNLVKEFDAYGDQTREERRLNGVFAILLSFGYLVISAMILANAIHWKFTSRGLTKFLFRFSGAIGLVFMTMISWIPEWSESTWPTSVPRRPQLQKTWGAPTTHYFLPFLDMGDVPVAHVFSAAIFGIIITILFYIDHNISSIAAYNPCFNLKKPSAYNLDFLTLGLTCLVTGFMGLPASSGLIPQNPMHSRALVEYVPVKMQKRSNVSPASSVATAPKKKDPMGGDDDLAVADKQSENVSIPMIQVDVDKNGDTSSEEKEAEQEDAILIREKPKNGSDTPKSKGDDQVEEPELEIYVAEQRVSGLIHSSLLLLCIFVIPMIGWVPTSIIWGFFLILSTEAFHVGNEFLCRFFMMFSSVRMRETWNMVFLDVVPWNIIWYFTMIQTVCFIVVYILAVGVTLFAPGASWTVVGSLFPVLIGLYAIPLRSHWLPKMFKTQFLEALDAVEPLVRPENEIPVLEEEPEDHFLPYVGRGAAGEEHVVRRESVERMLDEANGDHHVAAALDVNREGIRHREPSRRRSSKTDI